MLAVIQIDVGLFHNQFPDKKIIT